MTMRVSATAAKKATGAAFFAAALGIGIIAFSAQTERLGDSSWKGYRVLLVDESVPETEVLESLKGAGFDKVLSESTEPVLVSYWAEPETIGLAAARARLAPGDLRLDAYLQRLSLWFEARVGGAAYRAFYVGTEPSFAVAGINRRMKETLKGFAGRFVLADAGNPVPTKSGATLPFALAAVLLIASAVIGPLIGKKSISIRGLLERKTGRQISDRIAFRLVLLMPWAALASGGLSAAALGALWGLAFAEFADRLDIPLDEYRRGGGLRASIGTLGRQGGPSYALTATALLALALAPEAAGSVALACLGSIFAAAGYTVFTASPATRKRFVPMPIGRAQRRSGAYAAERARGLLACACVALWGLGSFLTTSAATAVPAGLSYPTPVAVRGASRPMPAEARSRSSSETGSTLPGIASYLEHLAFQEALPFVPIGENRSDPFSSAGLPLPDGKAQVLSFDDDWARKAYASLPVPSLEAMLLAQGPATVGRAGGSSALVGAPPARIGRPLAPIECLLYIFLLVLPAARLFKGIPKAKGALSGELRQEA